MHGKLEIFGANDESAADHGAEEEQENSRNEVREATTGIKYLDAAQKQSQEWTNKSGSSRDSVMISSAVVDQLRELEKLRVSLSSGKHGGPDNSEHDGLRANEETRTSEEFETLHRENASLREEVKRLNAVIAQQEHAERRTNHQRSKGTRERLAKVDEARRAMEKAREREEATLEELKARGDEVKELKRKLARAQKEVKQFSDANMRLQQEVHINRQLLGQ